MDDEENVHPKTLQNETPKMIADFFVGSITVAQEYGWLIVIAIFVCLYIKHKLKPSIEKMKQQAQDARDKKIEPSEAHKRLEAMEMARMRLQEEHERRSEEFKEKQKQKEEEKRRQKIEDWENHQEGRGYRNKTRVKEETPSATGLAKKPKPKLRDSDYNPLTGSSGGSCSWRPARRGGAGGG